MSNATPSQGAVVEAILSYSPRRLKGLLDRGYDVNRPFLDDVIETFDPNSAEEDYQPGSENMVALSGIPGDSAVAYPLHIAVVCFFHGAIKGRQLEQFSEEKGIYARERSLEMMDVLLAGGARWQRGCGAIVVFNTGDYKWVTFHANYPDNRAVDLALFLKKYAKTDEAKHYMDLAVQKLEDASRETRKKTPPSLKTASVLQSAVDSYRSLLFSEDFADVTFKCSDGISVPAHRNILAAASPYFKTAFGGNWLENNSDGTWETSHDSKMMKSVLTLVYTGSVDECEKLMKDEGTDPLGLMNLACEYQIEALVQLSVDNCTKRLRVDNVPMVRNALTNAHVHSCTKLKRACFAFVQKHSTKLLMSPEMMSLAAETPELWTELGDYLNGENPQRQSKRARTSGN